MEKFLHKTHRIFNQKKNHQKKTHIRFYFIYIELYKKTRESERKQQDD